MKNNRKGFTLTELVIVIAVIAILAAVLIPTFTGIIGKANDSAVLQEARNVYTNYMVEHDYTSGAPAEDLVVEVDDKYIAVVDGVMEDKVYDNLADAKTKAGATATVICDEHNWDATTGKCQDCAEVCGHDYTDAEANNEECGICGKTEA